MKKKKSPVKVVVPLILAVAAAGVGYKVVNRYIPSKEVMDGNEYFGTSGGEDAAVVLPDRLEQGKALVKDGTAYVEYATAKVLAQSLYAEVGQSEAFNFRNVNGCIAVEIGRASCRERV